MGQYQTSVEEDVRPVPLRLLAWLGGLVGWGAWRAAAHEARASELESGHGRISKLMLCPVTPKGERPNEDVHWSNTLAFEDHERLGPSTIITEAPSRWCPACPRCGADTLLRTAQRDRERSGTYWGCVHFPSCDGTIDSN